MKTAKFQFIVIFSVCGITGGEVAAQQPFWQRVDSVERFSWSVAFGDAGEIFTADGKSGVYKSINDGRHWAAANEGLVNRTVHDMYFDAAGRLFAATNDGVFRSDDRAEHWTRASAGLPEGPVHVLASGGDDTLFALPGMRVYRSINAGNRWDLIGPPGTAPCSGVCVTGSGVLIVSTDDTLYRSTDAGATWRVCHARPRETFLPPIVDTRGVVYTAANFGKVLLSGDEGITWTTLYPGLGHISVLAAGSDGYLYSSMYAAKGLVRSNDGAATWTDVPASDSPGSEYTTRIAMDPQGRLITCDHFDGVFRYAPDFSFKEPLRGRALYYELPTMALSRLAISDSGSMAVLPEHDGLFRSNDGGITWIPTDVSFPQSWGNRVFVGGARHSMYVVSSDSLYISTDGAATWHAAPAPADTYTTVRPLQSGTLLLGSRQWIYRSTDQGATWNVVTQSAGPHSVIGIAQDTRGDVYALVDANRLLVSTDDGNTWLIRASTGFDGSYTKIACGAAGRVYAVKGMGPVVAASDDGGATFRSANTGMSPNELTAFSTDAQGRVFAAGAWWVSGGVYISADFGASWRKQNSGFYSVEYQWAFEPGVMDLVRGPAGRMYALTDSGLYCGSDWPLGVDKSKAQPANIGHVYPNPFRSGTTVTWTLERKQHVDVQVFDLLGRRVASLASGMFAAGTHSIPFTGSGLPQGSYFVRIGTADRSRLFMIVKQ
ncbi:MAG: T9SS type A sorting domain-containing protein [Ignavibacteriae bacterium]|nr:T9SS type A sorting domain-containing protein [Ignavibacteriota bacterium]